MAKAIPASWYSNPTGSISASQPQVRYVTKNIEDIRVGDEVVAYDIRSGTVSKRRVSGVFERQSDHIRYLSVAGEGGKIQRFETTDSHAYWVLEANPDLSRAAREEVTVANVGGADLELLHENIGHTDDGFMSKRAT